MDKRKNPNVFPMKTTNLNEIVQIKKKKPRMKYAEKVIYKD